MHICIKGNVCSKGLGVVELRVSVVSVMEHLRAGAENVSLLRDYKEIDIQLLKSGDLQSSKGSN